MPTLIQMATPHTRRAVTYKHNVDSGTAVNQFPGAGVTQFNLAGTPLNENNPIQVVPNPNAFTTLPSISNIIKVTIQ